MSTGKLDGKVAVITGAASGIGAAVARVFAEEGAWVMLGDLNDCDATLAQIREAGGRAEAMRVDTRSEEACTALVAEAKERFGRVDTGVFAAGIRQDPVPMLDLELDALRRMIDINLLGVFHSARAMARALVAQGEGGTIVTIASTAGKIPIAGSAPYCMAKAGVLMMTKVMAAELAETGVRVNAVAPGFTATPMWDFDEGTEEDAWAMSMTPMKRTGTPEEQARACLFLACEDSSYTTGQTLYSAGGQFVD